MTEVRSFLKDTQDCSCGCGAHGVIVKRTGHPKGCRVDCPTCARPAKKSRPKGDSAELRRARRAVAARAQGRCEARIPGVCRGAGEHAHHIRRRSQGGRDTARNLLWVCGAGGCHEHIHAHPEWAIAHGFLAARTSEPNTSAVLAVERVAPLYDQDQEGV